MFSLLRGCYALGRAELEHTHSTVCESNYDHVVLARFSVWSSIFDFFWCWEDQDALSRPLFCFSLNNCKKKIKGKRGSFPDRASFRPVERRPERGSWLLRSHFRQHRRLQWSSYSLIIHSGVLSTKRPGSFMAVIFAGERAVWGKKPRQRGCSVFAIKRKQVVGASPD